LAAVATGLIVSFFVDAPFPSSYWTVKKTRCVVERSHEEDDVDMIIKPALVPRTLLLTAGWGMV